MLHSGRLLPHLRVFDQAFLPSASISLSFSLYICIYIYVCVCVCVCMSFCQFKEFQLAQNDREKHNHMGGQTDRQTFIQIERHTKNEGQLYGQACSRIHKQTFKQVQIKHIGTQRDVQISILFRQMTHRYSDRQTDGQTDRLTRILTDRQTDRYICRLIDKAGRFLQNPKLQKSKNELLFCAT